MRIKEIKIVNYGPIKNFHLKCERFNLIYGRNEAGKTALVDAITSALFQGKAIFPGQERFEKDTPGDLRRSVFLNVEHSGREYIFPGKLRFEKIVNLPHYHLASLFIIRAGDLSLREDEVWQDRIKEFLSGIPVNIEKIWEKIADEVGVTPKGEWSDRGPRYIKSEIKRKEEKKKSLIEAIGRLKSIKEKEKILEEKVKKREKLKEKSEKIRLLKLYREKERIGKIYYDWLSRKRHLLDYERYREEDYREWLKKEEERSKLMIEKKNVEKYIQEIKGELDDFSQKEDLLKREKEKLVSERDRLNALSITDEVREIEVARKNTESDRLKILYYLVSGSVLGIGGIFLLFLMRKDIFYIFLSVLLLLAGVCFLILSYALKAKEHKLQKKEESVIRKSRKIWPDIKKVEDILKMSSSFDLSISQIEARIKGILEEKEKKFLRLKEEERKFDEVRKKIEKVEEEVKILRDKTGLPEVDKLREKLEEKRNLELFVNSKEQMLKDILRTDDPAIWEKEATEEIEKPEVSDEELKMQEKIEEEISRLDEEIDSLRAEITSFTSGELGRLNITRATDIWREIEEIENELNSFYFNRKAALLARDVLSEISKEMEKVLADAVRDKKEGASFYFEKITCGRYRELLWKNGSIYALASNGRNYPLDVLSSGTKDQLLFSLRLGLIKRGFSEEAFILLDDAFLTSDAIRRKEQVKVCRELLDEGWQIFYFTVDEGLRDLFCKICCVEPFILG